MAVTVGNPIANSSIQKPVSSSIAKTVRSIAKILRQHCKDEN